MWILILEYCFATLLLGWLLFGYAIWLRFLGGRQKQPGVELPRSCPRLSVIVPCLNEETQHHIAGSVSDKIVKLPCFTCQ